LLLLLLLLPPPTEEITSEITVIELIVACPNSR